MSTILTLHDPAAARRYYAEGTWRDDTLYGLLEQHAAARPAAFALRDATRRLTWAALRDWADAVADDMHAAGVRRGQRVGVWLPNRVEAVVVFLACSRNGYVCTPSLHRNHTTAQIVQLMRRVGAAALVLQPGYGADAERSDIVRDISGLESLRRIYAIDRGPAGEAARAHREPAAAPAVPFPPADTRPRRLIAADRNPDKIVYLAFTSGTTGEPKGVMHSDNTLLANGRPMVADWKLGTRTVILSLSPMSHHIGTVAFEQLLVCGGELVLDDPPAGRSRLDWIVESGATYVMGVPTHAIDVQAAMRRAGLARLGKVAMFYMAGAPIPREVCRAFLQIGVTPQNIYGMTENGSHQYTLPSDDEETIVGTCGRANAGYEVKIFAADDPDREMPVGEVGQICSRGGNLTLGYFADQAVTEASFNASGWFLSGDLGVLDARGCLTIVGRQKDLIIRGGHNIHPAEIEDVALSHPKIEKAAAFGVADERLGEKVCLAYIASDRTEIPPDTLLAHLDQAGLSRYHMPEYLVALPEFPLTPSGKILKRALVEWVKTGRIAPRPVRFQPQKAE
jgi:acyl-CoA synthetase